MLKYVAVFRCFYGDGTDSRTGEERFVDIDIEKRISAKDDTDATAQVKSLTELLRKSKDRLPKRGHSSPSRVEFVKLVQVTERIVLI